MKKLVLLFYVCSPYLWADLNTKTNTLSECSLSCTLIHYLEKVRHGIYSFTAKIFFLSFMSIEATEFPVIVMPKFQLQTPHHNLHNLRVWSTLSTSKARASEMREEIQLLRSQSSKAVAVIHPYLPFFSCLCQYQQLSIPNRFVNCFY